MNALEQFKENYDWLKMNQILENNYFNLFYTENNQKRYNEKTNFKKKLNILVKTDKEPNQTEKLLISLYLKDMEIQKIKANISEPATCSSIKEIIKVSTNEVVGGPRLLSSEKEEEKPIIYPTIEYIDKFSRNEVDIQLDGIDDYRTVKLALKDDICKVYQKIKENNKFFWTWVGYAFHREISDMPKQLRGKDNKNEENLFSLDKIPILFIKINKEPKIEPVDGILPRGEYKSYKIVNGYIQSITDDDKGINIS